MFETENSHKSQYFRSLVCSQSEIELHSRILAWSRRRYRRTHGRPKASRLADWSLTGARLFPRAGLARWRGSGSSRSPTIFPLYTAFFASAKDASESLSLVEIILVASVVGCCINNRYSEQIINDIKSHLVFCIITVTFGLDSATPLLAVDFESPAESVNSCWKILHQKGSDCLFRYLKSTG